MLTYDKPIPGYQVSVVRLSCSACGAEANASCNCGQPYVPVKERVAEYDKANPGKSNRAVADAIGVDEKSVRKARADQSAPETVTGRDGKTYKVTKPKLKVTYEEHTISAPYYVSQPTLSQRPTYEPEPGENDLIDFIVDHFKRLSRTAQTRCAIQLRNVLRGKV